MDLAAIWGTPLWLVCPEIVHGGGRGLQSAVHTWEREVVGVAGYLSGVEDDMVKGAMRLQKALQSKRITNILSTSQDILSRYNMEADATEGDSSPKALANQLWKKQTEALCHDHKQTEV